MGKGGHTSCTHNQICGNVFGFDRGVSPFFEDTKSNDKTLPSTITTNSKKQLKQIKNNDKKQKKIEKKSIQFSIINIFNTNNNISFSAASLDEQQNKDKIDLTKTINNNNYNPIIIEETTINIENKDEITKEEEEQLPEELPEEEQYEAHIEEEEDKEYYKEFETIVQSIGNINEIGEEYEFGLTNKKNCLIKRTTKQSKVIRVNRDRWVKSIEESKKDRKQYWLLFHYVRQQDKRPKHIKSMDNRYDGSNRIKEESSYEAQLRKALSLSASEYDKQLKKEILPLTQNQINDILNRELTPEDYELLLLLDTNVKPKTVNEQEINALPLVKFSAQLQQKYPSCMICLTAFELNELITQLKCCDHIFHNLCISQWLGVASNKCPIDGIEI